jgi:hypothetical protein
MRGQTAAALDLQYKIGQSFPGLILLLRHARLLVEIRFLVGPLSDFQNRPLPDVRNISHLRTLE